MGTQETHLLLSSRFYAYSKGGRPWGLPNHLWAEAPHMLVLFDHLVCDEEAFKAEEASHRVLGWVNSGLFVDLKAKGILVTERMQDIVSGSPKPRRQLGPVRLDAYYAAQVQRALGYALFDWDRAILDETRTLAPSLRRKSPSRSSSALKLSYLWSVIASTSQVSPPLGSLTGSQGAAFREALRLQAPWWRRLERIEIGIDEYLAALTGWKHLYEAIDVPLEPTVRRNYEEFLRYRDKTERERALIRSLVLEAFETRKAFSAYAARVQIELAKALPSLFPALTSAAGKFLIGMAALGGSSLAEYFGYHVPEMLKRVGGPAAMLGLRSAYQTVANKVEERRLANPLRFMVKAARRHFRP
jgi:hypothetical protein